MPIYINNQNHSNKFWKYEIDDLQISIEWGRIGGASSNQTKTFTQKHKLDEFVSKKIKEKVRKGYEKSSKECLKKESKTAQIIGHQYKIEKLLWISMKGDTVTQIGGYDPKQYVYVEILNSWSKKVTRMVLGRDETYMVNGSISEYDRSISFGSKTKLGFSLFADAVRKHLKEMSEVIAETLKTIKFAAAGVRDLSDDDSSNETEMPREIDDMLSGVDTSGLGSSVVAKFATMGSRTLEF